MDRCTQSHVYAPMWFEIKSSPKIIHGPHHMMTMIKLMDKYCTPEVKMVIERVVERGAWHAHPENVILSLIGSQDESERKFAIDMIKKVRDGENYGDTSVRDFHAPKLNFKADSLFDIIDWSGTTETLFEPVLTCTVSTEELDRYLSEPFPKPDAPCHTQSCEWAVKVG